MNYIICGPPGSGKTTYALKKMMWGDLIIDIELLYHALTGLPYHKKPYNILPLILDLREQLYKLIFNGNYELQNIFFIIMGNDKNERIKLSNMFNAKVIVLEIPPNECLLRIQNDPYRKNNSIKWKSIIDKWWKNYSSNETDIIIP